MKDKLVNIYTMISALSVSGDAVDVIAGIRMQLRDLIQEVDNGRQTDKQPASGDKR